MKAPQIESDNGENDQAIAPLVTALRLRCPFFGTLALFARYQTRPDIPTAQTDGKVIAFNPEFLRKHTPRQQLGLLAHEVLHCALLHAERRNDRDPLR